MVLHFMNNHEDMLLQKDGAPPHSAVKVRNFSQHTTGGPLDWKKNLQFNFLFFMSLFLVIFFSWTLTLLIYRTSTLSFTLTSYNSNGNVMCVLIVIVPYFNKLFGIFIKGLDVKYAKIKVYRCKILS